MRECKNFLFYSIAIFTALKPTPYAAVSNRQSFTEINPTRLYLVENLQCSSSDTHERATPASSSAVYSPFYFSIRERFEADDSDDDDLPSLDYIAAGGDGAKQRRQTSNRNDAVEPRGLITDADSLAGLERQTAVSLVNARARSCAFCVLLL